MRPEDKQECAVSRSQESGVREGGSIHLCPMLPRRRKTKSEPWTLSKQCEVTVAWTSTGEAVVRTEARSEWVKD